MVALVVANFTLFMLEEAPVAIRAETLGEELFALLRLVFIILRLLDQEFMLSVCELAFRPVSADPVLDPVLAELSFKLCCIEFLGCLTHI